MTIDTEIPQETAKVCLERGEHDFGAPAIVTRRSWAFFFWDRADVAVCFCKRCGAWTTAGWEADG